MAAQYNFKNPAVKRLMKEAQELREPTDQYFAQPLEDNLFEWHFTIRGPDDSDFEGGYYHGRIVLPPEYPMKPPSIILLTPNGRFELYKKICLSISGYHPESWQPSWSIRTAILAIIGFLPTKGEGAIGALDYTPEERKALARKSQTWSCDSCGLIKQKLKAAGDKLTVKSQSQIRDEELAKQISFSKPKLEAKENAKTDTPDSTSEPTSATSTPPNNEGLRQRQISSNPPESPPIPDPQPTQPTPRPTTQTNSATQRASEDSTPLMLIIILGVVLAVLLLRRLDRVYDVRSNIADMF